MGIKHYYTEFQKIKIGGGQRPEKKKVGIIGEQRIGEVVERPNSASLVINT